jgi:hypothetical protein
MFEINQNVIFIWNYNEYPCKIIGKKENDIYIVEFSPNIEAGSINTIRDIHIMNLKDNEKIVKKEIVIRI